MNKLQTNKELAEALIKALKPTTKKGHNHFTGEFLDLLENYFSETITNTLKTQLEIWIERNDPNLYEKDEKEYWETMGSLTTLLTIKDYIKNNL